MEAASLVLGRVAVAVVAGPGDRANMCLAMRPDSCSATGRRGDAVRTRTPQSAWRPGMQLDIEYAEDDEDAASLADAISGKVVREAVTGRSATSGVQQDTRALVSPHPRPSP